jgi:hypothetical protein
MPRYGFSPDDVGDQIANALSWITDLPIRSDRVVVEPLKEAGQFLVTVYESDQAVDKIIPYVDNPIPTTIGELCLVGFRTNRNPYKLNLLQHGLAIGGTGSGKTNLMNIVLAHATRCPDCILLVGGTWKLYDFIGEWVEPYLGTGIKPPFDCIAHGHADVAELMAAGLRMAEYRFSKRTTERAVLPKVILVLDEVTYTVTQNRFIKVDGQNCDAMLASYARGTGGANMFTLSDTQRDTIDNLGDNGGTTLAQMGYVFVFRIRDSGSIGRTMEKWQLPTPTRRGECWLDPGPDDGIVKLITPYMQSSDPNKPKLHDGPTISEVAWSRRGIQHILDEGSRIAAGEWYNNHPKLITEEFLDYLMTPQKVGQQNNSNSGGGIESSLLGNITMAELEAAEQEIRRMGGFNNSSNINDNGGSGSDLRGATDLSSYRTLTEQVLAVVKLATDPLQRAEIIEQLSSQGITVKNPQVVTNILNNYCKADPPQLQKTDDHKYYAA